MSPAQGVAMRTLAFTPSLSVALFALAGCPVPQVPEPDDSGPILDDDPSPECVALNERLQTSFAALNAATPGAVAIDALDCAPVVAVSEGLRPSDLHRIASVTKTYVAASVVSLAREGALDLDAEARALIPAELDVDIPAGVTVRHLLQHTSGIADYLADPALFDEALSDPEREWDLADLVRRGLALDVTNEPGGPWSYSNTNYLALGLILEQVTGKSWPEVVHERAIDKAQLAHTFVDGADEFDDDIAHGFAAGLGDTTFALNPTFPASAGAIVATPGDGARWIRALHGTDSVLDAEGRALMSGDVVEMAPGIGYGLGTMTMDAAAVGVNSIGHDGSIPGYLTFSFYLPDFDAGVLAVVDDQAGDPNAFFVAALEALEVGQ